MRWSNSFPPPLIDLVTDSGYPSVIGGDTPAVSGSIASLALSASTTVVFDLGPNWRQYVRGALLIDLGATPTGMAIGPWASLDGANNFSYLGTPNATALSNTSTNNPNISSRYNNAVFNVMSRYIRIQFIMGSGGNALGAAAKILLTAYPS